MSEEEEKQAKKGGKTVSDFKGVPDIKTAISKHIRSMPRQDDRYYLDLYLLQKEQQRLEREAGWADKRKKRVQKRASDVQQEIAAQEKKALEGMSILQESPPDRPSQIEDKEETQSDKHKAKKWTTMSLEY